MGSQPAAVAAVESERNTFFRILFHDDRNSFYVLSSCEDGAWVDVPLRRRQLPYQRFNPAASYYITHNGFSQPRRTLDATRQLNALFFDLDCHGVSNFACRRLVEQARERISAAVAGGQLPQPTMTVDSGRGLHLYYVLERSIPYRTTRDGVTELNEKSVTFYKDVQERLALVLDGVLAGLEGISVDRAVFDHARVARIPGTLNAKAGRHARLLGTPGPYCTLSGLAAVLPAKQRERGPARSARKGSVIRFDKLMMMRLSKVTELQAHRSYNCEGTRELMSFVFYNTAVQIYDRTEARERLEAFNARFTHPLPASELKGIINSVDTVVNVKGQTGHYILTAGTVIRLLDLSDEEIRAVNFFASKRTVERQEAKRKTREKRAHRNERICQLYATGTMTQAQVAEVVGCSARTVFTVLKAADAPHVAAKKVQQITRTQRKLTLKDRSKSILAGQKPCSALTTHRDFANDHLAISCHTCLGGSAEGQLSGKDPVLGVTPDAAFESDYRLVLDGCFRFNPDEYRDCPSPPLTGGSSAVASESSLAERMRAAGSVCAT